MKKRSVGKKVAVVALSSVLAVGALSALAGCGGNSATTLTVYLFCNQSDEQTNKAIMNNWAKRYSEENNLGFDIKIDPRVEYEKGTYYEEITNIARGGAEKLPDVMYLAPRHVRKFSRLGYVMDLTSYLQDSSFDALDKVWTNAISYYGYDGTDNYVMGQTIEYSAEKGKFVTSADTNREVGLYGLPKDYSNFSMGYNKQFFSKELVSDYQTHKGSETRDVVNPTASNPNLGNAKGVTVQKYTGGAGKGIATFAASGKYNIYDENGKVVGEATATAGQEAPILAIGVPVTYKPFNYYLFNDYQQAKENGDPIANLVAGLTRDRGFTVTIPGLPGWTFNVEDAKGYTKDGAAYNAAVNKEAEYDATIGHTVLTYQEYGALTWAMTYYLNTFAWENRSNVLEGSGGKLFNEGNKATQYAIYGGEQYEGAQGNALYLLPWLAASDVDILNEAATTALNPTGVASRNDLASDANKDRKATEYAGTTSEKRTKVNLDGTLREVDVQYGLNAADFLKVYAAYGNHGAIWNGNAGGAKDGKKDDKLTGWNYFRMGRSVFYGAGSWDAATRNDSDPTAFEFGQMAAPVAEEYALYSTTATPDYDANGILTYSNANNAKGTGANALASDKAQRSTMSEGLKTYDESEIYANLLLRQDKWAARMDSVGYAANGRLARLSADDKEAWKAKAAASLIEELTVRENEQITLTYAGAQLPNFRVQCTDFLKYQDKTYSNYENGAFKEMLTPEGFADNTPYGGDEKGRDIWDYYYKVAVEMAKDSNNKDRKGWTVKQWIEEAGYGDYDGTDKGSSTKTLRYDTQYDDMTLSEFTGESKNNYYTSMKILRMVNFTYADRDLNIRMQTGLNAVRDSTMYTPDDKWLKELDSAGATPSTYMLSYYSSLLVPSSSLATALAGGRTSAIARNYTYANRNNPEHSQWWTPAYFSTYFAYTANSNLQSSIESENNLLAGK